MGSRSSTKQDISTSTTSSTYVDSSTSVDNSIDDFSQTYLADDGSIVVGPSGTYEQYVTDASRTNIADDGSIIVGSGGSYDQQVIDASDRSFTSIDTSDRSTNYLDASQSYQADQRQYVDRRVDDSVTAEAGSTVFGDYAEVSYVDAGALATAQALGGQAFDFADAAGTQAFEFGNAAGTRAFEFGNQALGLAGATLARGLDAGTEYAAQNAEIAAQSIGATERQTRAFYDALSGVTTQALSANQANVEQTIDAANRAVDGAEAVIRAGLGLAGNVVEGYAPQTPYVAQADAQANIAKVALIGIAVLAIGAFALRG